MDNNSLWTKMIACLDAHDVSGASQYAKILGDRLLAGSHFPRFPHLTPEGLGTVLKWLAGLTEGKEPTTIEIEKQVRTETTRKVVDTDSVLKTLLESLFPDSPIDMPAAEASITIMRGFRETKKAESKTRVQNNIMRRAFRRLHEELSEATKELGPRGAMNAGIKRILVQLDDLAKNNTEQTPDALVMQRDRLRERLQALEAEWRAEAESWGIHVQAGTYLMFADELAAIREESDFAHEAQGAAQVADRIRALLSDTPTAPACSHPALLWDPAGQVIRCDTVGCSAAWGLPSGLTPTAPAVVPVERLRVVAAGTVTGLLRERIVSLCDEAERNAKGGDGA